MLGIKKLWVKDDGQNPTASLKDRASAMAVAKAQEAGAEIDRLLVHGQRRRAPSRATPRPAGLKTYIFVPARAPKGKVAQLMIFGANVISVKGNYEDTFELSARRPSTNGAGTTATPPSTPTSPRARRPSPSRSPSSSTGRCPTIIAISVGDGCTIAGVWKGLKDLYAIGFIDRLPRLISAPVLRAATPSTAPSQENKPWEPMEENTLADSIAVGVPRNADKALMAIRESNGIVVNVSDEEILAAQQLLGRTCGVFGEPAGVTGAAA